MTGRVFVDTNVLIYAHDLDAGIKHQVAVSLIEDLWELDKSSIEGFQIKWRFKSE